MLEDKCHVLDAKLALLDKSNHISNKKDLDSFAINQNMVRNLEMSAQQYQEKVDLVYEAISIAMIQNPDDAENIHKIYGPRLEFLKSKMHEKVR